MGTRPEAIKLAPVIQRLADTPGLSHHLCVTGQHRAMLDQVIGVFGLGVDSDLALMTERQSLSGLMARALNSLDEVITQFEPDWVIVQGDTTTALAGGLAGFHRRVKVAHVEAGLRTHDLTSPFPEEANRQLLSRLATLHFPPTPRSRDNLLAEAIDPERVKLVGNTVIDALLWAADRTAQAPVSIPDFDLDSIPGERRLILVTGHRRENLDGGLVNVCRALRRLAERSDVHIVYPVHLNPLVREAVEATLGGVENVDLIAPLGYLQFVQAMQRSHFLISDSGGIQEEAPALGKPVLVTRNTTERPEALEAGTSCLVGTEEQAVFDAATRLLDDPAAYRAMAEAANPFGDGLSSQRIVDALLGAPDSQVLWNVPTGRR
jgi:UDP-N-acetylglucosamine 2-epimerase